MKPRPKITLQQRLVACAWASAGIALPILLPFGGWGLPFSLVCGIAAGMALDKQ